MWFSNLKKGVDPISNDFERYLFDSLIDKKGQPVPAEPGHRLCLR
jgi:hypothetical protein